MTPLQGRSEPILGQSNDPRFSYEFLSGTTPIGSDDIVEILEPVNTVPGSLRKNYAEMEGTFYSTKVAGKIRVGPHCRMKIKLSTKLKSPLVYFQPKDNIFSLNNQDMLFLQGFYSNTNGEIEVWMLNMSHDVRVIQKGLMVGKVFKAYDVKPEPVPAHDVHSLGHQSADSLSPEELAERTLFLNTELGLDTNEMLNAEQKTRVLNMFLNNFDAVSTGSDDFGQSDLVQFSIQLLPGSRPHRAKCRPLNPIQETDLHRQLTEWSDSDIIEPSCSDWAAALVPCKKKGSDRLRWATDYRILNSLTVKDAYPLPNIETNINKLMGARIFSSLDSAGAYHAVNIERNSRDYTTFVSTFGTFRFKRMPFGLSNSPAAYCRLVQKALDYLPRGFTLAYLDDILVYSPDIDSHLDHLEQVVQLHGEVGMKLNLKKCVLFANTVDYLGFQVSPGGIGMIPTYVDRILDWPEPTSGKEIQSFLGFCNYYRGFIPKFSEITSCLNRLRSSSVIILSAEEREAVIKLKTAFVSAPIRAYPDWNSEEPFILSTDYSSIAMAGVLTQFQDGQERFIGAFSKTCNPAESNYSAHKGEACALIYSLRKFEPLFRAKKFVIRTDSHSLTFMQNMKEQRGIWARWHIYLSSFNFVMIHRPGKENVCADALSRTIIACPEVEDIQDDDKEPYADLDDIYFINDGTLDSISMEEWVLRSRTDFDISLVKNFVKDKYKPTMQQRRGLSRMTNQLLNQFDQLSVDKELLYFSAPVVNEELKSPRVCVPSILQDRVVQAAHVTGTAHSGITETYEKLHRYCYFPNMLHSCSIHVNNCVQCLQKTNKLRKHNNSLYHELLSYPGQRVYCDTVGPLSPSRANGVVNKHLFTILDGFTRYLIAVPVPNIESATLLKVFLDHYVYKHGLPETMHTDQGSSFTSKLFSDSLAQLGVLLTHTPAYSPDANRVERSHRSLGALLRADDSDIPGAWSTKIGSLLFGHNVAVCRSTGVSPFFAMYGRNPRLPLDVLFPFRQVNSPVQWTTFVTGLNRSFAETARKMSGVELTRYGFNNEIKCPRVSYEFMVGDIVYYFSPKGRLGLSRKLTCRWTGPWIIMKLVSDSLSIILPQGQWMSLRNRDKEIPALNSRLRKMDGSTAPEIDEVSDVDSDGEEETGFVDFGTTENNYDNYSPVGPTASDSEDSQDNEPRLTETDAIPDREDDVENPEIDPVDEEGLPVSTEESTDNLEIPIKNEFPLTIPPNEVLHESVTMKISKPVRPPLMLRRLGPQPTVSDETTRIPRSAAEVAAQRIGQQIGRRQLKRK